MSPDKIKLDKVLPVSRQVRILGGVLLFLILGGIVLGRYRFGKERLIPEEEKCIKSGTGKEMSLSEAKAIASESQCVEEGDFKETYFCNQNTGTWWLDLDIQKEGCAPSCVVDVSTGEAEINWRCTGFIPSEKFTCPPAGTLNCMPGPDRPEVKYCTSVYSAWIEANCPGVQMVW